MLFETMNNSMRFLYFSQPREGINVVYRFLTAPGLTRPELTVVKNDSGSLQTYTNADLLTEEEFFRTISATGFDALSCVASTDKADERRVSLLLMRSQNTVAVCFPASEGKLNEAEEELLRYLGA